MCVCLCEYRHLLWSLRARGRSRRKVDRLRNAIEIVIENHIPGGADTLHDVSVRCYIEFQNIILLSSKLLNPII